MAKKILVCMMLSIFASTFLFGQKSNMDACFGFIKQNQYNKALTELNKAVADPSTKADALITKILVNLYLSDMSTTDNDVLELIKSVDDPNPYLFSIWFTELFAGRDLSFSNNMIDLLEKILEDKRINSTLKAHINESIAKHWMFKGEKSKAEKYFAKIGSLNKWQAVGVFENISESGFNKEFEPISKPQSDAKFTDKIGAPISWFTLPEYMPGKWINLAQHFSTRNSIIYAQTFVESPVEQEVEVRIGTSGSLKFWINDALVISESEERNNGMDTYNAKVKLNKGFNRLLLQLGSSEITESNFNLRILDLKGEVINSLKTIAQYQPYTKSTANQAVVGSQFAEEYFLKKLQNDPDNLLYNLLLSQTYQIQEKKSKAINYAKKAYDLAPSCGIILQSLLNAYLREDDETHASIVREEWKKADPNSEFAMEYEFQELVKAEKYDDLEKLLTKYKSNSKDKEKIYEKELLVYFFQKNMQQLFETVQKAHEEYPENLLFLRFLFGMTVEQNKTEALTIILDYLKEGISNSVVNMLIEYFTDSKMINKALDVYDNYLIEYAPEIAMNYKLKGELLFSARKYKEALEQFKFAMTLAPNLSFLYSSIGDCHKELGDTAEAALAYKNAITYDPQNYEARNDYRKLLGRQSLIDLNPEPDFEAIINAAPSKDQYPEDNSIILLDESIKVVYKGGGSETKCFYVVKMFNKAGIDRWKEYYVPIKYGQDGTIEKAKIYKKKSGKMLDAETEDGYVVFTNLEPDDAIVIVYKTQDYMPGTLMKHFWEDISFTYGYPCLKSKFTLVSEKGVEYNQVNVNSDIKPTVVENEDYKALTWEKTKISSIKPEAGMPPYYDVAERVFISTIPDWNYVSKWYVDLSASKAKSNDDVKEAVKTIFPNGYTNLSEKERAFKIYQFVVKEIKYSSVPFRQSGLIPQKASKTIITKMGDCKDVSTLFATLCREVGLEAGLVLIELNDNGTKSMPLPTISFEHVIGYVMINNIKYYIELTSDKLPFSTVDNDLKNSKALEINPKTTNDMFLLNPNTALPNEVRRESKVSFDGTTMKVTKNSVKTGGEAASMRYIYKDIGKEEREKEMQSAIAYDYPKIKLTKLNIDDNISNQSDSVTYQYEYEVEDVFTSITNLNIFKLPLADAEKSTEIVSMKERKFDLRTEALFYTDLFVENLEIQIPDTLEIADLPENVNLTNPAADYSITYEVKGNKLFVNRTLKRKANIIPVAEFSKFKEFYQKIVKTDALQIAFKAKSPESAKPSTKKVKKGK